jgi:hypothetical protein
MPTAHNSASTTIPTTIHPIMGRRYCVLRAASTEIALKQRSHLTRIDSARSNTAKKNDDVFQMSMRIITTPFSDRASWNYFEMCLRDFSQSLSSPWAGLTHPSMIGPGTDERIQTAAPMLSMR